MTTNPDVLVIGAGVVGLTTAVHLAEKGLSVRVIGDEAPRATTSAVAAAILGGPAIADPAVLEAEWAPVASTLAWHRAGLAEFAALAERPDTGVRFATGRMVSSQDGTISEEWAARLPGFRLCGPGERAGFPLAFWTTMPVVDMPLYLDHLEERLTVAGGSVEIGTVGSLADVAGAAPTIVNCTGAAAGRLTGDEKIAPVRGQHVIVENPGLDEFVFEFSRGPRPTTIVPHPDRVILGGIADRGNPSREVDPEQTADILRRCTAVEPRLAGARVLDVQVGLRAGRGQVRLEAEQVAGTTVVHCYGHGGVAVSMSWGCAAEVGNKVTQLVPR